MSNENQYENKPEKCVYIGNKYFFNQGKYSINPRSIGLPFCLILFIYNYVHINYYLKELIEEKTNYIIILIIDIILFSLQIFQSLNIAFTDPGSFLPNYEEKKLDCSEAKLMVATISNQDYFLKFCRTCLNARDLRVYHCPDCGLCIIRHDHHCPWLSTCIGLKNHKHFLFLVIINIIFFIFNTILLITFLISIKIKEKISEFGQAEKIFFYFLLILNGFLSLFHLGLLITNLIYIITGQTTREKIKRKKGAINPFTTNSLYQNIIEFWKYPMKYKERIKYNDNASTFLDTNVLICDYFSGNYCLTPSKKVISKTYVDYGYDYNSGTVELINNLIEEKETNYNNNLDEGQYSKI